VQSPCALHCARGKKSGRGGGALLVPARHGRVVGMESSFGLQARSLYRKVKTREEVVLITKEEMDETKMIRRSSKLSAGCVA
jgi:hypothetical protein